MVFYTSDLHLGHENILHLCNRPFKDIEEMDRTIIENWNKRVHKRDTVYLLGDVLWDRRRVGEYMSALNGKKILITGNHDGPWAKKAANQGYFESVLPYLETHLNGYAVTMCHYPMLEWKGSREDPPHRIGYHIHGHIHNRVADEYIPLYRQFNALNAGMDVNGFVPVTFEELLENNMAFKLACLARDEDRAYLLAGLERHPFRCVGSDSV